MTKNEHGGFDADSNPPAIATSSSSDVFPFTGYTPGFFTAPWMVTRWLLFSLTNTETCGFWR